jgi:hypothetical protein
LFSAPGPDFAPRLLRPRTAAGTSSFWKSEVLRLEIRRWAAGLSPLKAQCKEGKGIDAPRDKYFKSAMSFANWKINPRIVRAFVDKSAIPSAGSRNWE